MNITYHSTNKKNKLFLKNLLILILANKYLFLNLLNMDLKTEYERFIHIFLGHHHSSILWS